MDRAKKALDTEKEKTADERDDALVAQLEQQYKTALIENETWLPGGTGRKVVNALNAAVGGNLSAGATQFVQMGIANYLQQEGASLLGRWTHEGKLTEGSPLHAALHGAVGCLGAAAGGGDCGAGGMGAATSSLLTNLFTDQPNETFAEKETKRDIIVGLTTAMALGTNLDPGTAMNSAVSSLDNNWITKEMNDAADQARASTDDQELKDTITRQIRVISDAQDEDLFNYSEKVLIQTAEEGWSHERMVEEMNRYWSDQHLNPAEDVLPDYEPAYDSDYQRREFFRGIRKTGNDMADQLSKWGSQLVDGPAQMASDAWDGIKSIPGNIYNGAANAGQSVTDWATSEFPGMELEREFYDYLNTPPDEYAEDLIKSGAGLYGARRFELLWRKTPNTPSSGGRLEESLGSSDREDLFPDYTHTSDNARTVGQNEASNHSGVDGRVTHNGTGTVWDSIQRVDAYGNYPGTDLPRAYITEIEGKQLFIAPNATKHIQEELTRTISSRNVNIGGKVPSWQSRNSIKGENFTYLPDPVRTQEALTSLHGGVSNIIKNNNVQFNKIYVSDDGWEIIFAPPRKAGELPAIKHARMLN
ncbi:hypothetical protein BFW38_10700 [Terasakiispira papahanaumokuakeensis]|uniref:DUF637 domain-containing protein n=1 Tax=Terasakiispira papahanaumokuakeensis TaxID=197479 RepID=A0A1E2VA94_9GAMM|nr:DUF637 domain-containing protein [Terasakiispira papahanaumokuakeensis]ODC03938.1 hypothetical protein BFW38_10700 [Terasakiispira papahanaumokuakeensis]